MLIDVHECQFSDQLCVRANCCNAQVAEYGEEEEMVGIIKACVNTVTRGGGAGKKLSSSSSSPEKQRQPPAYVKVACLLGLRVSPSHRYGGHLLLRRFASIFSPLELLHFHLMRRMHAQCANASIFRLDTNVLSSLA